MDCSEHFHSQDRENSVERSAMLSQRRFYPLTPIQETRWPVSHALSRNEPSPEPSMKHSINAA